jgi:hypothetical protein
MVFGLESQPEFRRHAEVAAQSPGRTVGRESEAHPAFRIMPSPDAERHHLPPTHGYVLVPKLSLGTPYFLANFNLAIWTRESAKSHFVILCVANDLVVTGSYGIIRSLHSLRMPGVGTFAEVASMPHFSWVANYNERRYSAMVQLSFFPR